MAMVMDPIPDADDLRGLMIRVALHEAAHAVVLMSRGLRATFASVAPETPGCHGYVDYHSGDRPDHTVDFSQYDSPDGPPDFEDDPIRLELFEDQILATLAGGAAEHLAGIGDGTGSEVDEQGALALAEEAYPDLDHDQLRELLEDRRRRACEILSDPVTWDAVGRIAAALRERKELDEGELLDLWQSRSTAPTPSP